MTDNTQQHFSNAHTLRHYIIYYTKHCYTISFIVLSEILFSFVNKSQQLSDDVCNTLNHLWYCSLSQQCFSFTFCAYQVQSAIVNILTLKTNIIIYTVHTEILYLLPLYIVSGKNGTTILLPVICQMPTDLHNSITDRLCQQICNNVSIKYPTTAYMSLHYLVKYQVQISCHTQVLRKLTCKT